MNVMISQPMKGLSTDEINNNRKKALETLTKKGYNVVDTVFTDYPGEVNKHVPVFYLAKSIDMLSRVDVLYMMKGWADARGCKIEHDIAKAYGIDVQYE